MYKFIDTTEVSESVVLPSEALQINGEYIENLIDGYRTLCVSGREALSPELSYFETGVRDGSVLQSKRYPARIIIVSYQLIAESNEAFREAYNKLGKILNVENAELIFNDELDKYYVGTPSAIGEIEPGRNAVVGEIEILCTDPFKYSVTEYEAVQEGDSFLINYNGTYKSYPKLVTEFYKENEVSEDGESTTALTGNGDCGFVAFYNDNKKIVQLGEPEEIDKEPVPASQTLMNQTFLTNVAWGTGAKKLWTVNSGATLPTEIAQVGSVGMKVSGESAGDLVGTHYMTATSYGASQPGWHGASIAREIGADAAGYVGAKNFLVSFKHKMSVGNNAGDTKQYGCFSLALLDEEDNMLMGIQVQKYSAGKSGALVFYVGARRAKGIVIDLSYGNKHLGHGNITSYIRKTENEFVFNMCGHRYSFVNDELKDKVARRVVVAFTTYADKKPLTHNGLFWLRLVKQNCDTWANIPNKFGANDVLEADCRSGEILLNGTLSPELGALGNDWEEFYLKPGINQIDATYSEWVNDAYAPNFKLKYREVFL